MAQRPYRGLPPTPPTQPSITTPAASPRQDLAAAAAAATPAGAAAWQAPTKEPASRARVTWSGGVLSIAADDSSLNQILREICRQTGMTVTGGVADERVYGTYGPGAPGVVLASLLLGTGSNMLLKENAANGPVELVLTPRHGGATPPGPSTYARNDEREDDLPPQRIVPSSRAPSFAAQPASAPAQGTNSSGTPPEGAAPAAAASGGAPAATTEQQSPNGVKTPQQIYDQLMKLQQQKATQPPQ